MTRTLTLEVWSDVACPWCYVGKRRMEAALERFPEAARVALTWRSFELDPHAERVKDPSMSYAERLSGKYGTPLEQAEEMIRTMTEAAAAEGLDFHFERIRPGNTLDAHRLIHLAAGHGRADAMKERLFRAYLVEGEPIGDPDVLGRLAAEVDLDPAEARAVLEGERFEREVRADEMEATRLGIQGVPCFVFDRRFALSGAQPPEALLAALARARDEEPAPGPDGG